MSLDLEQAIFVKLSTNAGVSALVSSRVYPFAIPPTATMPCIAYQIIAADNSTTHDEAPGSGLVDKEIQIDAYAETYAGAVQLAAAIYSCLQGFKGLITQGMDTFNIQACFRISERDDHDAETALYWRSQDFTMWAQE